MPCCGNFHLPRLEMGSNRMVGFKVFQTDLLNRGVLKLPTHRLLCVVVSNIFYFHPYLGKIPILTNIFQIG